MLLTKPYFIPSCLNACENFVNCDNTDQRKLKVTFNNIARYIFRKSCDPISSCSYQILTSVLRIYWSANVLFFCIKLSSLGNRLIFIGQLYSRNLIMVGKLCQYLRLVLFFFSTILADILFVYIYVILIMLIFLCLVINF